jgi:hypothetical protein
VDQDLRLGPRPNRHLCQSLFHALRGPIFIVLLYDRSGVSQCDGNIRHSLRHIHPNGDYGSYHVRAGNFANRSSIRFDARSL